jgi:hypothetical protein
MMIRRFCVLSLILLASALPLIALDGEVVTVTGKVEIQDTKGTWKPLKAGSALAAGSMISTGFKSEATVKLGASILTIKPLTRMTLTELVEKEDIVNTELYLEVGNVKAEVNSLNNKKNGFTVKSPVATASVRGTIFGVQDDGETTIEQGVVQVENSLGQTRDGTAGQQLSFVEDSIASPVTAMQTQMNNIPLETTPSTQVTSTILATTPSAPSAPPPVTAATPTPTPPPTVVVTPKTTTLEITVD